MNFLSTYLQRISLTLKMVLLTIGVGFALWFVLDQFVVKTISDFFITQLNERLNQQQTAYRYRFGNYVYSFSKAVKLYANQQQLVTHLQSDPWHDQKTDKIQYHRRPPSWFVKTSVLRFVAMPRFTFLFDSENKVREVYHFKKEKIPEFFFSQSSRFLALTNDISYLFNLDKKPYLASSESIFDAAGNKLGTLMISSPLDDKFLLASQGQHSEGIIMALVEEDTKKVLVSSDPDHLPSGALFNSISENQVTISQQYFEYGSSEVKFKFMTIASIEEVKGLTQSFVQKWRDHRAIMALIYTVFFTLIMFWITYRVSKVTKEIENYSLHSLGEKEQDEFSGDQLNILMQRFQTMVIKIDLRTEQLNQANNELRTAMETIRQTQEKLLLTEKIAVAGQMSGIVAHEVLNPISSILSRLENNLKDSDTIDLVLEKMTREVALLRDWHESGELIDVNNHGANQKLGMLDKIRNAFSQNESKRREDLQFCIKQVNRVVSIIEGLRQMTKPKREMVSLNLDTILLESLADMKDNIEKNNIAMSMDIDKVHPVQGDYSEIYSVFSNLLRNAIQAIQGSENNHNGQITIQLHKIENDFIEALFQDNGVGISPNKWETIFETGYTSKNKQGTGLGLAYSRKVARSFNGDISVLSSSPEEGTVFRVLFGDKQSFYDSA